MVRSAFLVVVAFAVASATAQDRAPTSRPPAPAPDASLDVDFIFPTLKPLVNPRLQVSEGNTMARLTEKLLIGDTDSFLHRPVLLAVRPT